VRSTLAGLKQLGYEGVILGHAREVVLSQDDVESEDHPISRREKDRCDAEDIETWKQNLIETINLAEKGDFVGLKFSGAGRQALSHLRKTKPCSAAFEQAIHEMCQLAAQRGVSLLFDAEQDALQDAIDNWTMYFAKAYNKGDRALVYGTYQAYKKKTPQVLAKHLEIASKDNFVLGVKLVRGAYLGSDPRDLFWPTIEKTHECFNDIAERLIQRKYGGLLISSPQSPAQMPQVDLFLASHNAESIERARKLRDRQASNGEPRIRLSYGQLMGMADNLSCELVKASRELRDQNQTTLDRPQAYKYVVWGKMGECMKYLLRRAQENRDAVSRTVDARKALARELGRRVGLCRS
jgi:hypothetical protein